VTLSILLQILWTGLAVSSYAVLFAMAFSLILKVVKIWNFAQAGFMGLVFYSLYVSLNIFEWPMWAGVVLSFLVTTLAAIAFFHYGIETLRARHSSSLTFFILTLVVSQFMGYLFAMCFGTEPLTITKNIMSPVMLVGGIVVSHWDLQAMGLTALTVLLVYWILNRTHMGQFMSAVADHPGLARLYGIDVSRVYLYTIALACLLLTVGVYLFGLKVAMLPNTPLQMMLLAVIATLLGGMGQVFGAAAAAVLLSLIQSLSVFVIPSEWQSLLIYAFLFMTILFFPEGFSWTAMKSWFTVRRA
jgi:branched-chain amino acid transport system permease protein